MTTAELVIVLIAGATALTLPFGAWRAAVPRFTWKWFVAIHLPIPLIVLLRVGLDLGWWYMPVSLACTLAGQLLGGRLSAHLRRRRNVVKAEPAE